MAARLDLKWVTSSSLLFRPSVPQTEMSASLASLRRTWTDMMRESRPDWMKDWLLTKEEGEREGGHNCISKPNTLRSVSVVSSHLLHIFEVLWSSLYWYTCTVIRDWISSMEESMPTADLKGLFSSRGPHCTSLKRLCTETIAVGSQTNMERKHFWTLTRAKLPKCVEAGS